MELALLLAQIPPRHVLFFTFLAQTGLRVSEAIGLQWSDLDLGRRRVHARRRIYRGTVALPKSRYGVRDVPITQAIAQTLEPIGSPMIGPSGGGGFSLGLSADRARLLSGGVNSVLWDVAERTQIGDTFPGIQMWPGPDASDRGFSVEDGNILVWSLNTDEWYGIACRAAGRNMTRVEWEEVGLRDEDYQATCSQFPLEPETGS